MKEKEIPLVIYCTSSVLQSYIWFRSAVCFSCVSRTARCPTHSQRIFALVQPVSSLVRKVKVWLQTRTTSEGRSLIWWLVHSNPSRCLVFFSPKFWEVMGTLYSTFSVHECRLSSTDTQTLPDVIEFVWFFCSHRQWGC